MPIPTDTFWNIRRLNVIFALSALSLVMQALSSSRATADELALVRKMVDELEVRKP